MKRLLIDSLPDYSKLQHRFVLDSSAINHIKWIMRNQVTTEFFLTIPKWAIPPYNPMYVEIPFTDYGLDSLGFVIIGHYIQPFWYGKNEISEPPMCWSYETPSTLRIRPDVVEAETPERLDKMIQFGMEIVAYGVTALFLLNQPSTHKIERVDHKRGILKGKSVVYKAHNKVTIDLNQDEKTRREFFNTGTRGPYRRHEVRGQWVNYHKHEDCTHAFVEREVKNPDPDRPRYICEHCGQFRTWKPSFERGDASKGWASKQYQVTHSRNHNDPQPGTPV